MFEKFLIENWKDVLRYAHSVKVSALGVAIIGGYYVLPQDVRALLPSWTINAVAIFDLIAVIFVRIIQQDPLSGNGKRDNDVGNNS